MEHYFIFNFRASTPQIPFADSSEETTRPNSPDQENKKNILEKVSEESLTDSKGRNIVLSEEGESSGDEVLVEETPDEHEEDDDDGVIRGEFVPGGAGDIIDLGGCMYNIAAEDPMGQEIIHLSQSHSQLQDKPVIPTAIAFTLQQPATAMVNNGTSFIPVSLASNHIQPMPQELVHFCFQYF